jgi:hypothetical protein
MRPWGLPSGFPSRDRVVTIAREPDPRPAPPYRLQRRTRRSYFRRRRALPEYSSDSRRRDLRPARRASKLPADPCWRCRCASPGGVRQSGFRDERGERGGGAAGLPIAPRDVRPAVLTHLDVPETILGVRASLGQIPRAIWIQAPGCSRFGPACRPDREHFDRVPKRTYADLVRTGGPRFEPAEVGGSRDRARKSRVNAGLSSRRLPWCLR